jgi:hypothetical protein
MAAPSASQATEHASGPFDVAAEQGIHPLLRVMTGDIEHRLAHRCPVQGTGREQQGQLVEFLSRSRQVALDPRGEEVQGLRIRPLRLRRPDARRSSAGVRPAAAGCQSSTLPAASRARNQTDLRVDQSVPPMLTRVTVSSGRRSQ